MSTLRYNDEEGLFLRQLSWQMVDSTAQSFYVAVTCDKGEKPGFTTIRAAQNRLCAPHIEALSKTHVVVFVSRCTHTISPRLSSIFRLEEVGRLQ